MKSFNLQVSSLSSLHINQHHKNKTVFRKVYPHDCFLSRSFQSVRVYYYVCMWWNKSIKFQDADQNGSYIYKKINENFSRDRLDSKLSHVTRERWLWEIHIGPWTWRSQ